MLAVCRMFECPPDVAERQDWQLVQRVMEWAAFEHAVTLYRDPKRRGELAQQPGLVAVLIEARRAQLEAQVGQPIIGQDEAIMASLSEVFAADEDDDGERG